MINAHAARSMTQNTIDSTRNTPEFKTAIKNIEQFIAEEVRNGKLYVRKNLCAMCTNWNDFPSAKLREAVAAYVRENGYMYTEGSTMAPNGNYNMWFQIAW